MDYYYEKPVSDFLNCYINKKTRDNYKVAIIHFLEQVIPPEKKAEEDDIDILAKGYLREIRRKKRDPMQDVKQYSVYLLNVYAPTTINLYLRCVIIWLEDNGYRITRRERRRISAQLPPPYPRIESIELKRKTLRSIYFALPEDVGVLLLVLLASGMRLGEALRLTKEDVDWTQERPEIHIPGTISKTKVPRTTYLTDEAAEALYTYLKYRKDKEETLFVISYARAQRALRIASVETGCTRIVHGDLCGVHWHMTRKWFLSRFALAASRDVAEHIAGHEGYLSRSYRRYTKKQILKQYKRAERKLSILRPDKF